MDSKYKLFRKKAQWRALYEFLDCIDDAVERELEEWYKTGGKEATWFVSINNRGEGIYFYYVLKSEAESEPSLDFDGFGRTTCKINLSNARVALDEFLDFLTRPEVEDFFDWDDDEI